MGIESDTATGWPATDWFEDLIMRYGGADGYNSWVTHETPFDSDLVREAAAEFEELMFTEGNVLGGRKAIASTNFGTAGNPMFDEASRAAGCTSRARFITGLLPRGRRRPTSTRTSASSASRPPRPAARTPSWVVATSPC